MPAARVLVCSLLLLSTLSAPAAAERKSPPQPIPVTVSGPTSPDALTCSVGATGTQRFLIDYLQPPDDAYFIAIGPEDCPTCVANPGFWLSAVKLTLEFRVPCAMPVEVAVVAAAGDTVCGLPVPARVVGGPWPGVVSSGAAGTFTSTLSLGHPCPITAPSYLQVRFVSAGAGCNTPETRPRLVTNSVCELCGAWNFYPGVTADLCALQFPGRPLISAVPDSCISPALTDAPGAGAGRMELRTTPNPVRGATRLEFTAPEASRASLAVRDVSGRTVRRLFDQVVAAGPHAVSWDARDDAGAMVRPGVYFAALRIGARSTTIPMVVVR